jgi:hypothetical protein
VLDDRSSDGPPVRALKAMPGTFDFHQPGTRDIASQRFAVRNGKHRVVSSVNHQDRYAQCGQGWMVTITPLEQVVVLGSREISGTRDIELDQFTRGTLIEGTFLSSDQAGVVAQIVDEGLPVGAVSRGRADEASERLGWRRQVTGSRDGAGGADQGQRASTRRVVQSEQLSEGAAG